MPFVNLAIHCHPVRVKSEMRRGMSLEGHAANPRQAKHVKTAGDSFEIVPGSGCQRRPISATPAPSLLDTATAFEKGCPAPPPRLSDLHLSNAQPLFSISRLDDYAISASLSYQRLTLGHSNGDATSTTNITNHLFPI